LLGYQELHVAAGDAVALDHVVEPAWLGCGLGVRVRTRG